MCKVLCCFDSREKNQYYVFQVNNVASNQTVMDTYLLAPSNFECMYSCNHPQIARFMGPTWGPPGSCRPQVGPMLASWTFISGSLEGTTKALQGSNFTVSNQIHLRQSPEEGSSAFNVLYRGRSGQCEITGALACSLNSILHDDVLIWTRFPYYSRFVWGIHR